MAITAPYELWRSCSQYAFDQKNAEAIIRTVAYHRNDSCLSVVWYPSREHDTVRASITKPFTRSADRGLGTLDQLPLEILQYVVSYMDMSTVFYFRQVNVSARKAVDSTHQYPLVVSHGLNPYYALLLTEAAQDVTLSAFYQALCSKACVFCNEFAGFISLLSWTRCCLKCLPEVFKAREDTRAADRKQLERAEAPRKRSFNDPGVETAMHELARKTQTSIPAAQLAILKTNAQFQDLESIRRRLPRNWPRRKPGFPHIYACALPYYNEQTGKIDHGVCCAGCQLAFEVDLAGGERRFRMWDARETVYTHDDFLEHFRWCKQGQLLWESSDGGHIVPPRMPTFARDGGNRVAEKCWHGQ